MNARGVDRWISYLAVRRQRRERWPSGGTGIARSEVNLAQARKEPET